MESTFVGVFRSLCILSGKSAIAHHEEIAMTIVAEETFCQRKLGEAFNR